MPFTQFSGLKILSLLRKQGLYGYSGYSTDSSGLSNSAHFIVDMLSDAFGINSKFVIVTDSNDVDRELDQFKPDIVIIEAHWITPDKLKQLTAMHRKVKWIMRNHSALPFIAQEGVAIEWMCEYSRVRNVWLGSNDPKTKREFEVITGERHGLYLPNYYPPEFFPRPDHYKADDNIVNIGCFGAIRPLKNQLLQAVAAIRYANMIDIHQELHFHVNGTRMEGGGEPIMKNLTALFDQNPRHYLEVHPWLKRGAFIDLMRTMDAHIQVSFNETFNIVSADATMNAVPIVTSPAIPWVDPYYMADPNDSRAIRDSLWRSLQNPERNYRQNKRYLRAYDEMVIDQWESELDYIAG